MLSIGLVTITIITTLFAIKDIKPNLVIALNNEITNFADAYFIEVIYSISNKFIFSLCLINASITLLLISHIDQPLLIFIMHLLIVLSTQDLLATCINGTIAYFGLFSILTITFYQNLITNYQMITIILLTIILICFAYLDLLGIGDLPIILSLQLILNPFIFSLLILVASTVAFLWLKFTKTNFSPFIPAITYSFYLFIILDIL